VAASKSAAPPGEALSASICDQGAERLLSCEGGAAAAASTARAVLHGLKPFHPGARQHAGIAQRGHDGHQRVKPGVRFAAAVRRLKRSCGSASCIICGKACCASSRAPGTR
jgi:hypothetical protein